MLKDTDEYTVSTSVISQTWRSNHNKTDLAGFQLITSPLPSAIFFLYYECLSLKRCATDPASFDMTEGIQ